jgi:hypothetical protein
MMTYCVACVPTTFVLLAWAKSAPSDQRLPVLVLFGCNLKRIYCTIGSVVEFLLLCILILPVQDVFVRNVSKSSCQRRLKARPNGIWQVSFAVFMVFFIFLHYWHESVDRCASSPLRHCLLTFEQTDLHPSSPTQDRFESAAKSSDAAKTGCFFKETVCQLHVSFILVGSDSKGDGSKTAFTSVVFRSTAPCWHL